MKIFCFIFFSLFMAVSKNSLSQDVVNSYQVWNFPMLGQSVEDTKSEINGIYYGLSTQGKEKNAWLLSLDFTTNKGMIYSPPNFLKIINLKRLKETQISFQSEADAGIVIKFSGILNQSSIQGKFTTYRETVGRLEYIFESVTSLQMIRSKTNSKCDDTHIYCGKYSNVKYNEDSGDLNGEELILVPTLSGIYCGVFTSYLEGGMPVAVDDLKIQENRIAFVIKRADGMIKYSGSIRNGRLTLNEHNPWGVPSKRRITLKATTSLNRLFAMPQGKK